MMKLMTSGLVATVMAFGLVTAVPTTTEAQQAGLVNVAIGDITTGDILSQNRVGVGVAAQVAANVCGVTAQVGVIAKQVARTGNFRCENEQTGRFAQIVR
jgi:hypothetical protein